MTDVWIVITEDRHIDVDADPFSTEADAIAYARLVAGGMARSGDVTETEPSPFADGCVLLLEYGTEGDCVSVIKRELDATP